MTDNSRRTLRLFPSISMSDSKSASNRVLDLNVECAPQRQSRAVHVHANKRNERRRGQALLVSVLLMLFASILGATFVTVVAVNLSQTARSSSVGEARDAAQAGLQFVNEQLTNSPLGERWTPKTLQLAPNPGSSNYTYYYSDFERAQGWDTAGFVKFPNPLSATVPGKSASTYLTKVEPVNGGDRDGQLKVTVIGRANDNDAAYSTLTFYKPTSQNGNMTSFARYDSNWNFRQNSLAASKLTADALNGATTIVVGAEFSSVLPGRTILIGNAPTPEPNIVTEVSVTGNAVTLTLRNSLTTALNTGTPVRVASTYMGGLEKIDARGTGNPLLASLQDTRIPEQYTNSLLPATVPNGADLRNGGIMVNSGLYLQGKSQFSLKTTGNKPDRVLVSGPITIDGTAIANVRNNANTEDIKTTTNLRDFVRYQTNEGFDPTNPNAVVAPLKPARIDSPNSRWLQMTKLTGDVGALYGYGRGVYIDNAQDMEKVTEKLYDPTLPTFTGVNAILPTRNMTIAETQRLWTRKSFSVKELGVEYGNADNIGVAGAGVVTQDASLPVATPSKNIYQRLSWARVGLNGDTYRFPMNSFIDGVREKSFTPSLEQRGLRGWISPSQFLPRGALIELKGNKIVITRDDLSDQPDTIRDITAPIDPSGTESNPEFNKPDADKAWKNPDGTPLTNPGARTYRMEIDMTTGQRSVGADGFTVPVGSPVTGGFNGVIYAEGNVRLRGFTNVNSKDITIVSMGNIYIDGAINQLSTTTGIVAPLAKKNVVLNPTQFATQPAGWRAGAPVSLTTVTSAAPVTAVPLSLIDVNDTSSFRVGDTVKVGNKQTWWTVTRIVVNTPVVPASPFAGQITLSNVDTNAVTTQGTFNPGDSIVALTDPLTDFRGTSLDNNQAIARNMPVDGIAPTGITYLSFMQAGENKTAFTLTNQSPTATAIASTKAETIAPANTVDVGEKKLVAAGSPAADYDLITNTFGGLMTSFNGAGAPAPDTNTSWDLNSTYLAMTAYRVASATASVPSLAARPFLLTTSTGIYWRQNPTDFSSALPAHDFLIGSPTLSANAEDRTTVDESFYGILDDTTTPLTPTFSQAPLKGFSYLLPSAPQFDANNAVSIRREPQAEADLAAYLYGGVKYDRVDLPAVAATPINVNVQATIYAQEGSWFVIPMPAMTPTNIAPTTPQIDQANKYRRLNYLINVQANIAENFAPTAVTDYNDEQTPDQLTTSAVSMGAQAQWLDASSYPSDGAGTIWQTINYTAPAPLPVNNNLYLPITPDISIQR